MCDKSIEALSLLEQGLLNRTLEKDDLVYKTYLDPERMEEVKVIEKEFLLALEQDTADDEISPS